MVPTGKLMSFQETKRTTEAPLATLLANGLDMTEQSPET